MSSGLILITPPAVEPVSLADAKNFLRIDTSDDDTLVTACIKAARRSVEEYTKRALITQTWEYWLDNIPHAKAGGAWWDGQREGSLAEVMSGGREIALPRAPLLSLVTLTTYDLSDNATVFSSANLIIDTAGVPGRIALKYGQIWPVNLRLTNSVQIRFTAGYSADNSLVPDDIMAAIRILIGHLYEKRELTESGRAIELPYSVDSLLAPYRILRL